MRIFSMDALRVAVFNRLKALNGGYTSLVFGGHGSCRVTLDSLELSCGTRRLVASKLALRAFELRSNLFNVDSNLRLGIKTKSQ